MQCTNRSEFVLLARSVIKSPNDALAHTLYMSLFIRDVSSDVHFSISGLLTRCTLLNNQYEDSIGDWGRRVLRYCDC